MCKNKKELDEYVDKFKRLNAEKKKIEDELEKVKTEIADYTKKKGRPGGKDNRSFIVDGKNYRVSCIPIEQEKINADRVKDYLGDLFPAFLKKSFYWKVDIR